MKRYRYRPRILTALILFTMLFMNNLPTVHADGGVSVDVESSDFKGGSSTYQGGVTYLRTGYLCYLVQKNGTLIDGMTAKAFKCSGYSALGGEYWDCYSKKGGYGKELTNFEGTAPWGYPCFNEDKTSNAESIKAWMQQKDDGVTLNAVQFVQDTWKNDTWSKNFRDGDYVLVLENILSFQPSVKRNITAYDIYNGKYPLHIVFNLNLGGYKYPYGGYVHEKMKATYKQVKHMYEDYNMKNPDKKLSPTEGAIKLTVELINRQIDRLTAEEIKKVINDPANGVKEGVGSPVVGTLYQCINYEREVGGNPAIFAGYTNKVACFSEYIGQGGAGEKAKKFIQTVWAGCSSQRYFRNGSSVKRTVILGLLKDKLKNKK